MAIDLPSYAFPNLSATNYEVTSQPSETYNCIGWAVGDDRRWWWPRPDAVRFYWPPGVERAVTIPAFLAALATVGFEPCRDGAAEPGYDKIALYTLDGVPTHAARLLPDGRWTSKLGNSYDIEHDLDALDGPVYGSPALFLRRPLTAARGPGTVAG